MNFFVDESFWSKERGLLLYIVIFMELVLYMWILYVFYIKNFVIDCMLISILLFLWIDECYYYFVVNCFIYI